MRLWGKRQPETVKVRHWPHGIQHDHVGVSPEDALRHAMECAGHTVTTVSVRNSAAFMQANGDRLEYVPTGKNPEIFRLVHRGKNW